jgi:hypothetical protein
MTVSDLQRIGGWRSLRDAAKAATVLCDILTHGKTSNKIILEVIP